jgi:hypothetical protein
VEFEEIPTAAAGETTPRSIPAKLDAQACMSVAVKRAATFGPAGGIEIREAIERLKVVVQRRRQATAPTIGQTLTTTSN